MHNGEMATVTDLTEYITVVGDELYEGNVVVGSGDDYEGETYIYCEGHPDAVYFDVSEEAESGNQGMVELIRFLWEHREC